MARKRRMESNVFVKPNEQNRACSSYAMARKRRMKSNHIPAKKLSFFEGKAGCQQVGTYGFFGFTQWGTKGAHTLRMKAASGKRTVQRLPLYIRAKKGGTDFKLFRYASNQDTVLLCLSLTHVKTVYGKFMVGLRKALTCLCPSFRIAKPLSSNCGTAMPDGDAETIKNTADGSDIHTPMEGKPSVAVHLREIPIFRGIQNIHAFNGFHSCFDFLRNTFFHNRYVLVEGKITKKKRETTVYNLSILNDESYVVPIGITHNCRCTVVQVLKDKYPVTPHNEAMALGEEATGKDTKGIFRFNPGIEQKTVPDYNPYTIRRCNDCDLAKGKTTLAFVPDNELCAACKLVRKCESQRYQTTKQYANGGKVQVHQLVNPADSDYEKLIHVADFFAKQGKSAKLTPKMSRPQKFVYQNIYHSLMGTKFEGKCPDLLIDGKWYEHEGFISTNPKNAFRNMMYDGLLQSNRLIIDRPDLTERYMRRSIYGRVNRGENIEEVWLREKDGTLTLLYKKTDG